MTWPGTSPDIAVFSGDSPGTAEEGPGRAWQESEPGAAQRALPILSDVRPGSWAAAGAKSPAAEAPPAGRGAGAESGQHHHLCSEGVSSSS